jgi:uncharacterized RDD family membrane protein YckC
MAAAEQRGFADQLNIDTPEQVELEFAIAGLGSRFVAVLIDHLIQGGVYFLIGILAAVLFSAVANRVNLLGKWIFAVLIALYFLLIWGYYTLFEALWRGQTPGKHIMKLRVIKDSGRQITFFEALSRNLLRIVDYLPAFYLTGVITMLCTKRHQRLGDLAAGTIVVHERSDEQPLLIERGTSIMPAQHAPGFDPLISAAAAQEASGLPADAVARLGADDLLLIESFFARALDLSPTTRADIAVRIATQMATKMNIAVPPGNPERFLEALAYAMRSAGRSRR